MTLPRLLSLVLFGAMLSAAPLAYAPLAHAQDDEEDPEPEVSDQEEPPAEAAPDLAAVYDRYLSLQVHGGIDTPFGVAGASIEFSPFRYLGIYAGGGIGRDGARIAGGLWGRVPVGRAAIGLMAGVGGGALGWDSPGFVGMQIHRYWEFALFLHAGVSFEYRWDEGFFFRLSFGADALVAGDPDDCRFSDTNACGLEGNNLAKPIRGWAGLTLGYALDL